MPLLRVGCNLGGKGASEIRRLTALVLTVALSSLGVAAAAQQDLTALTSHEPLQRILDGFVAGEPSEGLFLRGSDGSAIASQFQLLVNLGAGPVFGYQDVELLPAGLPDDGGLSLVSLEDQFDGLFGGTDFLPPLDPWRADGGTTDISEIATDWSAYGESGEIEGPIVVTEPATVVWGIELEEPFDEACASERWVGRAWQGQSVVSTNPTFTSEALGDWHPGTHDALAGQFSRLIEFGCPAGGDPIVRALRMTDDQGVRSFGPIDAVVLVKGRHLVFMHTGRTLTSVFDQNFFATPAAGGPITMSSPTEGDIPLLLPNPYQELPTRIQLKVDLEESGGSSGAAPTPRTVNLVHTLDSGKVIPVGFQCRVLASFLYGPDLLGPNAEEELAIFFLAVYSIWLEALVNDGILSYEIVHPDETRETVLIDLINMTWTAFVDQPSAPDCDVAGTVTVTGPGLPIEAVEEPPTDAGEEPPTDAGTGGGESGAPWVPIGIALALLATIAGAAVGRSRTRKRDCEPERQAYATARAAHDQAMKVRDHWWEEYKFVDSQYAEQKRKATNPLPAPDRVRGYPEGPEGEAAWARDQEEWQQLEEAALQAGENLDGFREASEEAKANLEEADAAVEAAGDALERARIALRECEKSGGSGGGATTPPPTPDRSRPKDGSARQCDPEGVTKIEPEAGLPTEEFTVPNGNVILRGHRMVSWNQAFGGVMGIGPQALVALTEAQIDAALADFDQQTDRTVVDPQIPTKIVRVACGRVWICENGKWVKTARTARLPDEVISQDVEEISTGAKSPSKQQIMLNVKAAKSRVEVLLANQANLTSFGCN